MKRKFLTKVIFATLAVTILFHPLYSVDASWQESPDKGWWNTNNSALGYSTGWEQIEGIWYYFDAQGWMQTGWINVNGTWYYINESGAMQTGWICINEIWYYLNESGAMCSNQWIGDYYVTDNGAMAIDSWIGGYYVDNAGKWVPGYSTQSGEWIQDRVGWWYQATDGSYPVSQWKLIGESWYYFDQNGYMVSNQWIGYYYVADNGVMAVNTWIGDGIINYYVGNDGKWIPENNESGVPLTEGEKLLLHEFDYWNSRVITAKQTISKLDDSLKAKISAFLTGYETDYFHTISIEQVNKKNRNYFGEDFELNALPLPNTEHFYPVSGRTATGQIITQWGDFGEDCPLYVVEKVERDGSNTRITLRNYIVNFNYYVSLSTNVYFEAETVIDLQQNSSSSFGCIITDLRTLIN